MPAESSIKDAPTQPVDANGQAGHAFGSWPYVLLLCVGCLILLPQLGSFGLWDPWEPKYVESVREMLERDSYFIPYYRDEVRLTKPILTYWGILAGSAVFGLNELGARIVGVLFALGAMLTVYYAVSTLRGRRAGLLSALVLGTSPLFYFLARQATPDIYLLTSLGSAWALFGLALFGPERRRTLHYVASYACFALAVLAKGPIVAGALYFGPLMLYALVRADTVAAWLPGARSGRVRLLGLAFCSGVLVPAYAAAVVGILRAGWPAAPRIALLSVGTAGAVIAAGALVREASRLMPAWRAGPAAELGKRFGRQAFLFAVTVLVVAGPWHIVVFFFQEESYLTDFIVKHNVRRIGTEINSSGIADFYLRPMIFGFFPWSCFLPLTLLPLLHRRAGELFRERGLEIYLVLAAVVTFVAFSIPVTKFPYYLAPILVPVAMLIGISLDDLIQARRTVLAKVAAIVALLLYLPPMVDLLRDGNIKYLVGAFTVKRFVPEASAAGLPFAVLLVVGAILLVGFALLRTRLILGLFASCALLLASYNAGTFIPRLSPHKTMKQLCQSWREFRTADEPIGFHGRVKHGIYFYTDSEVDFLSSRQSAVDFMAEARPAFAIVERSRLRELEQRYRLNDPDRRLWRIDESHFDYVLVANHAVDTINRAQGRDERPETAIPARDVRDSRSPAP